MPVETRTINIALQPQEWTWLEELAARRGIPLEHAIAVVAGNEIDRRINLAGVLRETFGDMRKGVPDGWPTCPCCGTPALDGHTTCGRNACNESSHRPNGAHVVEEGAERFGQLPSPN